MARSRNTSNKWGTPAPETRCHNDEPETWQHISVPLTNFLESVVEAHIEREKNK